MKSKKSLEFYLVEYDPLTKILDNCFSNTQEYEGENVYISKELLGITNQIIRINEYKNSFIKIESKTENKDYLIFSKIVKDKNGKDKTYLLIEKTLRSKKSKITGEEEKTLNWFSYLSRNNELNRENQKKLINHLETSKLNDLFIPRVKQALNYDNELSISIFNKEQILFNNLNYLNGIPITIENDIKEDILGFNIYMINSSKEFTLKNFSDGESTTLVESIYKKKNGKNFSILLNIKNSRKNNIKRELLGSERKFIKNITSVFNNLNEIYHFNQKNDDGTLDFKFHTEDIVNEYFSTKLRIQILHRAIEIYNNLPIWKIDNNIIIEYENGKCYLTTNNENDIITFKKTSKNINERIKIKIGLEINKKGENKALILNSYNENSNDLIERIFSKTRKKSIRNYTQYQIELL